MSKINKSAVTEKKDEFRLRINSSEEEYESQGDNDEKKKNSSHLPVDSFEEDLERKEYNDEVYINLTILILLV